MKTSSLNPLLWMTASLVLVVALNLSCGKSEKNKRETWDNPAGTNAPVITVAANAGALPMATRTETNIAPVTNLVVVAPETNVSISSVTNIPVVTPTVTVITKVIEMPTTPPVAPKNFYNESFSTNQIRRVDNDCDYYFAARVGYEHSGYGNNRDILYAGIKFYAHTDKLREKNERLRWLVPDAVFKFSHQALAQPDFDAGGGLQLRADFFWPWVNWTTQAFARENCDCAFARPMTISVGPVVSMGFDKTFDGSGFRFARYAGARLAVNRYAFVQYTWGRTDDFATWRQEFLAEVPFYISNDEQVRYVVRCEWMRGAMSEPDYYQFGVFVEMPLNLLIRPDEWHSLIPFAK